MTPILAIAGVERPAISMRKNPDEELGFGKWFPLRRPWARAGAGVDVRDIRQCGQSRSAAFPPGFLSRVIAWHGCDQDIFLRPEPLAESSLPFMVWGIAFRGRCGPSPAPSTVIDVRCRARPWDAITVKYDDGQTSSLSSELLRGRTRPGGGPGS
jgi:hypothetical protein